MSDTKCKDEYINRIHKVQDYIESHIGQQMTIEELAQVAGFSKYHFSRIFQSILHEPLAHYVNRIRMEISLFMLAHRNDKNMTDIAYELGFTESAIFSRAFKNYYGISPREYRSEYSKNCKDSFLMPQYNVDTAKEEWVQGPITIDSMKDKRAVYVRHTGTYETLAQEYKSLMDVLLGYAAANHINFHEDNWVLAMYHDNPEFGDENQFRTSLCLTIPEDIDFHEDGVIGLMKLEGGLYATGHFRVRPDQYGQAWNYMYQQWLTCSGYVPRNCSPFEVYLNNPSDNEEHISEVDIYVPIEPILF